MLSMMEILSENKAKDVKKYSMVAFYVPKELGEFIQSQFEDVEGDIVLPKDMHITLGLVRGGRKKLIHDLLKKAAKEIDPFDVEIKGIDTFPPNDSSDQKWVLHAKPVSEMFDVIHKKIFDLFSNHGIDISNGDFDFNLHITIKYCPKKPKLNKNIKLLFPINDIYYTHQDKRRGFKLKNE